MSQNGFKIAIALVVILAVSTLGIYFIKNHTSFIYKIIPQKQEDLLVIKFIDSTGKVISNTNIRLYSDNGVTCITAPCPTEGQEWTGETDVNGMIIVPLKTIKTNTSFTISGYGIKEGFVQNIKIISPNEWTVELSKR